MTRLDTLARRAAHDLQSEVKSVPVPLVDFRRIRERQIRRTIRTSVLAVAAVVIVVGVPIWLGSFAPEEPVAPATSVPPAGDPSPFLGSWVTTEIEGFDKAATLVIEASEDDTVEMIAHNLFYVCSGGPSTMTASARLQGGTDLVIPAPVFTCDDGSQLAVGSEQFENLTFTRDSSTGMLIDNFGHVWVRKGAEEQGAESNTPHSDTEITELLNGFIEARVAGEAAQQYLNGPAGDIPLLYATSAGAPYERGEFELTSGIEWSYGHAGFRVRLFAGDTVVEQIFTVAPAGRLGLGYPGSLGTGGDLAPTTEDGQPVAEAHDMFDGEVTLHVAHPWVSFGSDGPIKLIPEGSGPTTDGGERHDWDRLVLVADPSPPGSHCLTGNAPADAEALAENIRSAPELDATAPITVSAGGTEALMMDVVGTGGVVHACNGDPGSDAVLSLGKHIGLTPGYRVRLYLFDAPEGASMRILAIAIDVPESRFERAVEGPVPVVEFHAP